MAVIVTKKDNDTDLQRKIAADLRSKGVAAAEDDHDAPDLAEDSEYLKDTKKTGRFGWIWLVLIVLAIISLISIFAF